MNAAYNHGSQGDLTANRLDSADGERVPGRSFAPAGTGDLIRAAALEGDVVKLKGLMVIAIIITNIINVNNNNCPMYVYMSIDLFLLYLSINQSINLSIYQSIYLYISSFRPSGRGIRSSTRET